jgi:hypothetical protein
MRRHRVVGYNPSTERQEYNQSLPEWQVRRLVDFGPGDPFGYDAYELREATAEQLGLPPGLEYFVEPAPLEGHPFAQVTARSDQSFPIGSSAFHLLVHFVARMSAYQRVNVERPLTPKFGPILPPWIKKAPSGRRDDNSQV